MWTPVYEAAGRGFFGGMPAEGSGIDFRAVLNATSLRWLLAALVRWLNQPQQQAVAYLSLPLYLRAETKRRQFTPTEAGGASP